MPAAIAARPDALCHPQEQPERVGRTGPLVPEFSAAVPTRTGSNLTNFKGCVKAGRDTWGKIHLQLRHFREFGMAAIMNGLAPHGGFIPYGGLSSPSATTAVTPSAWPRSMKQRVIHVFTTTASATWATSAPTHQSSGEHVPSLHHPNLDVGGLPTG